ncbi:MAG: hypothetical protein VX527_01310 [Planctomycetota bacterium]|nr:hypothetical protein [Planctomycetota bacterium]
MTAKLMLILIGLGLTSLALLAHRQHRIDTAFEMTRIHDRCDDARTTLWDVRCRIAQYIATLDPLDQIEPDAATQQHLAKTHLNQPSISNGG